MLKQRLGLLSSLRPCSISSTKSIVYYSTGSHFKHSKEFWPNPIYTPVYSKEQLLQVQKSHHQTKDVVDKVALSTVKLLRTSFDVFSGYSIGRLTEAKVLRRAIFLETVAGVPGFVAAILRHLRSLRRMERDHGWIHTLLQEAENERMHLLTFIKLYQPGIIFRMAVLVTQGVFMNGFFFAYLINPRLCHRFVGYLEEEAVKTYGSILEAMDDGRLEDFKKRPAPEIAISYWNLGESATCRDLILAVRADEANHRDVNHTFASSPIDANNPYLNKKH